MMEDLRSEKAKRESAERYEKWSAGLKTNAATAERLRKKVWEGGAPWQPIDTCPFKVLDEAHVGHDRILVTDGKSVALATIRKRFGCPVRWKTPPKLAMTDDGMSYIGGEIEEIDAPKWWFEWELIDEFGSMNYAGGEEIGKDEVDFIATHWLPLPTPTGVVKAGKPSKSPRRSSVSR